uniref:Coiled-coil domain containing 33 n=1 Tax=Amphiprion percula TaxID=161767 RepID=A0A3P8TQT9_AMPPE
MCAFQLQKDVYNLPSHDALAQILPDYRTDKPNINYTYHIHPPHKRYDATFLHQEVENYRSAMTKMADDIITLRTQVGMLEAENSQLRSDLSLHQDLGQDLLTDTDIDVMTKAEIADRIATLKFKLASETSKTASQRNRIQELQNELIRKNDSEKELLKLQRIHHQQQADLQNHQTHMTKMVIEKMEKALDSKLREKKRQTDEADRKKEEVESTLAAENARLRIELDRIRQLPAPVITQQSRKDALPHNEKLSLLNKLERAEARIQTLEAQLEENAKLWGRQKQEMLTKLSEHKHGFVRTSTTILHNVSLVSYQ